MFVTRALLFKLMPTVFQLHFKEYSLGIGRFVICTSWRQVSLNANSVYTNSILSSAEGYATFNVRVTTLIGYNSMLKMSEYYEGFNITPLSNTISTFLYVTVSIGRKRCDYKGLLLYLTEVSNGVNRTRYYQPEQPSNIFTVVHFRLRIGFYRSETQPFWLLTFWGFLTVSVHYMWQILRNYLYINRLCFVHQY